VAQRVLKTATGPRNPGRHHRYMTTSRPTTPAQAVTALLDEMVSGDLVLVRCTTDSGDVVARPVPIYGAEIDTLLYHWDEDSSPTAQHSVVRDGQLWVLHADGAPVPGRELVALAERSCATAFAQDITFDWQSARRFARHDLVGIAARVITWSLYAAAADSDDPASTLDALLDHPSDVLRCAGLWASASSITIDDALVRAADLTAEQRQIATTLLAEGFNPFAVADAAALLAPAN
jgi:hypothetical protein